VKAAVEHCYEARDFTLLNSTITVLSKKHGQLKAAVQAIVELAMNYLDDIRQQTGTEQWLELVETLRGVTEGKVLNLYILLTICFIIHSHTDISGNPSGSRHSDAFSLS
jgi:hypothetical protein